MSSRAVLRCALAAVLFGISAPLASRLAGDLGPFTLAGLLYVGAGLAVVPLIGHHRPGAASLELVFTTIVAATLFREGSPVPASSVPLAASSCSQRLPSSERSSHGPCWASP